MPHIIINNCGECCKPSSTYQSSFNSSCKENKILHHEYSNQKQQNLPRKPIRPPVTPPA